MSCTHDCGCSPEIRDARTDEWVQIAPESARAATLTPEQPVKALPWGDGRIVRSGGGFSRSATRPRPASLSCVLTEDKPTQEPVLPRRIEPEDVQVGMVVERRKGEAAHRDRVHRIDGELIVGTDGAWLWVPGNADGGWALWLVEDKPTQEPVLPRRIEPEDVRVGMIIEQRNGVCIMQGRVVAVEDGVFQCEVAWLRTENERDDWSLWLVEDEPAPVDPDAEAVERMAKEVHDRNCADGGCRDWDGHGESTRKAWREDARVVIRNLRAQCFDVTPRAEQ